MSTTWSSPDPLTDAESIASSPHRRSPNPRARAHTPTRKSVLLRGNSPAKQTFELDVGDAISPKRIRVTVEAEPEHSTYAPQRPSSSDSGGRLSPSPYYSTPFRRSAMKVKTTTVPLRGLSDSEEDAPVATPNRGRGRPRKSTATPLPGKAKRTSTPAAATKPGAKTRRLSDLLGGSSGDNSEEWDFNIPQNVTVNRGRSESHSRAAPISALPAEFERASSEVPMSSRANKRGRRMGMEDGTPSAFGQSYKKPKIGQSRLGRLDFDAKPRNSVELERRSSESVVEPEQDVGFGPFDDSSRPSTGESGNPRDMGSSPPSASGQAAYPDHMKLRGGRRERQQSIGYQEFSFAQHDDEDYGQLSSIASAGSVRQPQLSPRREVALRSESLAHQSDSKLEEQAQDPYTATHHQSPRRISPLRSASAEPAAVHERDDSPAQKFYDQDSHSSSPAPSQHQQSSPRSQHSRHSADVPFPSLSPERQHDRALSNTSLPQIEHENEGDNDAFDEFDTIMENEDFTMITAETVPSLLQYFTSPLDPVEQAEIRAEIAAEEVQLAETERREDAAAQRRMGQSGFEDIVHQTIERNEEDEEMSWEAEDAPLQASILEPVAATAPNRQRLESLYPPNVEDDVMDLTGAFYAPIEETIVEREFEVLPPSRLRGGHLPLMQESSDDEVEEDTEMAHEVEVWKVENVEQRAKPVLRGPLPAEAFTTGREIPRSPLAHIAVDEEMDWSLTQSTREIPRSPIPGAAMGEEQDSSLAQSGEEITRSPARTQDVRGGEEEREGSEEFEQPPTPDEEDMAAKSPPIRVTGRGYQPSPTPEATFESEELPTADEEVLAPLSPPIKATGRGYVPSPTPAVETAAPYSPPIIANGRGYVPSPTPPTQPQNEWDEMNDQRSESDEGEEDHLNEQDQVREQSEFSDATDRNTPLPEIQDFPQRESLPDDTASIDVQAQDEDSQPSNASIQSSQPQNEPEIEDFVDANPPAEVTAQPIPRSSALLTPDETPSHSNMGGEEEVEDEDDVDIWALEAETYNRSRVAGHGEDDSLATFRALQQTSEPAVQKAVANVDVEQQAGEAQEEQAADVEGDLDQDREMAEAGQDDVAATVEPAPEPPTPGFKRSLQRSQVEIELEEVIQKAQKRRSGLPDEWMRQSRGSAFGNSVRDDTSAFDRTETSDQSRSLMGLGTDGVSEERPSMIGDASMIRRETRQREADERKAAEEKEAERIRALAASKEAERQKRREERESERRKRAEELEAELQKEREEREAKREAERRKRREERERARDEEINKEREERYRISLKVAQKENTDENNPFRMSGQGKRTFEPREVLAERPQESIPKERPDFLFDPPTRYAATPAVVDDDFEFRLPTKPDMKAFAVSHSSRVRGASDSVTPTRDELTGALYAGRREVTRSASVEPSQQESESEDDDEEEDAEVPVDAEMEDVTSQSASPSPSIKSQSSQSSSQSEDEQEDDAQSVNEEQDRDGDEKMDAVDESEDEDPFSHFSDSENEIVASTPMPPRGILRPRKRPSHSRPEPALPERPHQRRRRIDSPSEDESGSKSEQEQEEQCESQNEMEDDEQMQQRKDRRSTSANRHSGFRNGGLTRSPLKSSIRNPPPPGSPKKAVIFSATTAVSPESSFEDSARTVPVREQELRDQLEESDDDSEHSRSPSASPTPSLDDQDLDELDLADADASEDRSHLRKMTPYEWSKTHWKTLLAIKNSYELSPPSLDLIPAWIHDSPFVDETIWGGEEDGSMDLVVEAWMVDVAWRFVGEREGEGEDWEGEMEHVVKRVYGLVSVERKCVREGKRAPWEVVATGFQEVKKRTVERLDGEGRWVVVKDPERKGFFGLGVGWL